MHSISTKLLLRTEKKEYNQVKIRERKGRPGQHNSIVHGPSSFLTNYTMHPGGFLETIKSRCIFFISAEKLVMSHITSSTLDKGLNENNRRLSIVSNCNRVHNALEK